MSISRTCLGLVGVGQRGRAFITTVNNMKNVQITRVGSRSLETFRHVMPDCQVFTDWRSLLDPTTLDGLIVTTPSITHSTIVREALNVGLPVLTESPLATTIADAVSIKKLAYEKLVMVNYTVFMQPEYRFIKELKTSRAVGSILSIHAYAGTYVSCNRLILWDLGTQLLALCIDLLETSKPRDYSARVIQRNYKTNSSSKTIELHFDFSNANVHIFLSNSMEQGVYYFILYFEQLTVIYNSKTTLLTLHSPSPNFQIPKDNGQIIPMQKENPLNTILSRFTIAINSSVEERNNMDLEIDITSLLTHCQTFLET